MENTEKNGQEEAGKAAAYRISKRRTLSEIAVLLASGAGMTLAFAPVNQPLFAWICAIPLLWLCAGRTKKRAFLYGLIWGYAWHFTGTFFLREIMWAIPFVFAVVLGLFNAVFAMFIPPVFNNLLYPDEVRKADFDKRAKFFQYPAWGELTATFTLSALWILLEWLRSWIFTGFPWNLLGASQWQNFSMIQICEYTGIYGVSFLVIFMNIAAYFAAHGFRYSVPESRYKRPFPFLAAIVLLIIANSTGVQIFNSAQKRMAESQVELFAVGVVQPHLSQRRAGTSSQSQEALDTCYSLTKDLIIQDKQNASAREFLLNEPEQNSAPTASDIEMKKNLMPVRAVIWPETAVPRTYYAYGDYEQVRDAIRKQAETDPGQLARLDYVEKNMPFEAVYRRKVRSLLSELKTAPILLGTITYGDDGKSVYNSALLLKNGKDDPKKPKIDYDRADVYSKVHLVPFGEFVPLAWKFPVLDKVLGLGRSLTPGPAFRPIELAPGIRAGMLICYEDVFAYTAREHARNGANLLTVITNDAWYPVSSEPEQHYINSIFRTIETRLPMVRAGNSNYSVLIDPYGRLIDSVFKTFDSNGDATYYPERQKSGNAKFIVPVPRGPELTFYTRFGNIFVLLCAIIFACGAGTAMARAFLFARVVMDPIQAERERIRTAFIGFEKDKQNGKR